MTPDNRFDRIEEDVHYIRTQLDELKSSFAEHRVTMERRVAQLEVKAGFFGALGGALAWFAAHLVKA